MSKGDRLSPNAFWKLKKSLNLNTEVGNTVVLKNGTELFGESAIRSAYRDEFIYRLRKRSISDDLQKYEDLTNATCDLHVLEGINSHENLQFSVNKLTKIIKALKRNKSPGPDGFPAEIFIHAGGEFIKSITEMFNNIKRNHGVPRKWNMVKIKTLYKNKGSPKDLENYRGIFLTPTMAKLCEKYLINESADGIANINKFQAGSRPNRSAADQLFLVRACIDHARYLKITISVTLYDFKQCFDGMWLQDSILSVKNIGIANEVLSFIKKLNETSDIVVKTPVGETTEFTIKNIVKQGTVLGPLLCSASTAECCSEHTTGGVSIGSTCIRSLAYVDDILDINQDLESSNSAHEVVVNFTEKKRLELSWTKCSVIPINSRKNTMVPVLYVDGNLIKTEESAKYLGDIINSKGSHTNLVDDRVKKGDTCATNSFSMVQELNFGCHSIETILMLYKSLFLASVLCNAQSWSVLNKKELDKLKVCQMRFLKRILKAPRSAPNAIVLCELGVLPIEFEIYKKKLMFLQHILKLDDNDPVKEVYGQQSKYTSESNWTNEVIEIRRKINLNIEDEIIADISKEMWKSRVNRAIKEAAIESLNSDCKRLRKVTREYSDLKTRQYLYKLPPEDATIAFAYRSGTSDLKCHKQYNHNDLFCRACRESQEDTTHVVNQCTALTTDNTEEIDIESEDTDTIDKIVVKLKTFLQKYQ